MADNSGNGTVIEEIITHFVGLLPTRNGKSAPKAKEAVPEKGKDYYEFEEEDGEVRIILPEPIADYMSRTADWVESDEFQHYTTDASDGTSRMIVDWHKLTAPTKHRLCGIGTLPIWFRKKLKAAMTKLAVKDITNLHELEQSFASITTNTEGICFMHRMSDTWYPVTVTGELEKSFFGDQIFAVHIRYKVGGTVVSMWRVIDGKALQADELSHEDNMADILATFDLRVATADDRKHYDEQMATIRELESHPGRVMASTGFGLNVIDGGWHTIVEPIQLGTPENPYQVIVEPTLETKHNLYEFRTRDKGVPVLPVVRVFDLNSREFVYSDITKLSPYQFDDNALDNLATDSGYRNMLKRVFRAGARANEVADLVSGKHGGIIVLASGPSGVGKTMTAECVAQATHRPLYSVGLADLGTDLATVSDNLDKILLRAERWGAFVLFDEADVLMTKRGEELERAAIVGLFLHRVEYFQGFIFMTSNRPEVLDPAIMNRVNLHRVYHPLTDAQRAHIWTRFLDVAKLKLDGDITKLAEIPIDGRRIRNVVRWAELVHSAGSTITPDQIQSILDLSTTTASAV